MSGTRRRRLNGQDGQNVDEFLVNRFIQFDGLSDRNVNDLVVGDTYHDVPLALLQSLDAGVAEAAGEDPVVGGRASSTLEMAQDGDTDIIFRILLPHPFGVVHRSPVLRAFGDDHDRAVLALAAAVFDEFLQLVDVGLVLRDDGGLGTDGDGGVLRQETGVTPHNLDKEYAVVGGGRVPDLVHALDDGVKRRVITDCGVRTVKVIVTRNTVVENNVFFLNRMGDLSIPGGGNFINISSADFSDVEYIDSESGNTTVQDANIFKGKIDEAYLKGFLNASYTAEMQHNPNSAVNTFRSALGMNQIGTMTSKVTMYANRYNWEKALLLFGAMPGYGAQMPQ